MAETPQILQGTPFANAGTPAPEQQLPEITDPLSAAALTPAYDSGKARVPAPTVPMRPSDQQEEEQPDALDAMASAFVGHLINKDQMSNAGLAKQPGATAPPGSFASKLGNAAEALGAGLGDAAAANNGGKGGWLGGVARTLNARNERISKEQATKFDQQERLKNDQISLAKANIEMRHLALAVQQQEQGIRNDNAASGKNFIDSLRDNYKVTDDITQSQLSEMVKKDPSYLSTHTARITGYEQITGADGQPQLDAAGNPVESPIWSIADLKPGDANSTYVVGANTAKKWADAGLTPVAAGTRMPVAAANEMDMRASRFATTLGILNLGKVQTIPNEVKDQMVTALQDQEVQHAIASHPGSALGGLYAAQKTISDHMEAIKSAMATNQGPGIQDAGRQQLDKLAGIMDNINRAVNLGFTDGERKDYATELNKTTMENRQQEHQEEIERHNLRTEQIASDKIKALQESNDPAAADELGGYLAQGRMDPSQLSKRAKNYNASLVAANTYSMQHYGQPFDIAQAQTDYRYANQKGTKDTLNYLNSLTGADNKSGNLGDLVTQSNSLGRVSDFPPLEDKAQWLKLETGNAQVAAYHTTIMEVADQVAKILQGGGAGTSDAKLRQAQELFRSGFNKSQMEAVAKDLRGLLANRKKEMIGKNRYLQNEYGEGYNPGGTNQTQTQTPNTPPPATPPPGATKTITFQGHEYWVDNNGKNLGRVQGK